jgi:oxygen-independent coproporphyrinogen III oxidase
MAGIYIHIPFCKKACIYCNFHFSTSGKLRQDVLRAIAKELILQKDYLNGQSVSTIYFGGGTPSLLSADEICMLTDVITTNYSVSNLQEVTLEANPDDLTASYLKSLRNTHVDRLSIGVQSFREQDLLYLKRAHTAAQAASVVRLAQDAGFTNITIDLIYGIPNLQDVAWISNLAQTAALGVPHFSAYALTVEEKTELAYAIDKKRSAPVLPEQAATQFELLTDFAIANGYQHYEISNFAKPDCHAIHNSNYWRGVPYLGAGPSAHSYNGISRKWNIANNALYSQALMKDNQLLSEEEVLNDQQQLNEYIMTSLRTMWGCSLHHVATKWGSEPATRLRRFSDPYVAQNLMTVSDNVLLLTQNGKLFADRIASELFVEE